MRGTWGTHIPIQAIHSESIEFGQPLCRCCCYAPGKKHLAYIGMDSIHGTRTLMEKVGKLRRGRGMRRQQIGEHAALEQLAGKINIRGVRFGGHADRSEEHTSELQSL